MTLNWYDTNEIFSVSHFSIFSNGSNLHWSVFSDFETTHCMNCFHTKLIKLLKYCHFMVCAIFSNIR